MQNGLGVAGVRVFGHNCRFASFVTIEAVPALLEIFAMTPTSISEQCTKSVGRARGRIAR